MPLNASSSRSAINWVTMAKIKTEHSGFLYWLKTAYTFYLKSISILKSFKNSTNLDQVEISSLSRFQMILDWSLAPIFLIAKESKFLSLTTRHFLFYIFCRMKKSNEWYEIQGKNEVFWILYKMEPSRNHDSCSFWSFIKSKLVTLKR